MGRGKERDYDDFVKLKDDLLTKINEDNAAGMLESTKIQLLKALKKLDVNNITEVENLYLIVAQLTQAASYVRAQKKMADKDKTFDEALSSVDFAEVVSFLNKTLKNQPGIEHFSKFLVIDEKYKPSKEAWIGFHGTMLSMAVTRAQDVLRATVPAYRDHLKAKLIENGVNLDTIKEIQPGTLPRIQKLINRYNAIVTLDIKIKDKVYITLDDIEYAKTTVTTCLKNKPTWSERPFLQQLTDVLSLGLKFLYREFFSKEKDFQKKMEQAVNPPKIG